MKSQKFIRLLALVCVLSVLLEGMPIFAAWDGGPPLEVQEEVDDYYNLDEYDELIDMDDQTAIITVGGVPTTEHALTSKYALHWNNHPNNATLTFTDVPRDWSPYNYIEFGAYSETPTCARIEIILRDSGTIVGRFRKIIYWSGWETWKWNLEAINLYNGYKDLTQITDMTIYGAGYATGAGNPDSDLYFDYIHLLRKENTEYYTDRFYEASEGATAVVDYSRNFLKDGTVKTFDSENVNERTIVRDGVSLTPISFFADALGANVEKTKCDYVIELEDKSVTLRPNYSTYYINGVANQFVTSPYIQDDILCVPVVEVAKALGKSAKTLDHHLTLIGTDEHIAAVEKDKKVLYAGAKAVACTPLDPEVIKPEDWHFARNKWREAYVGSEELNDLSNEDIKARIAAVDSSAEKHWSTFDRNADVDKQIKLFEHGEYSLSGNSDVAVWHADLKTMARAWATYGSKYYHNEALKEDILFALEWLYDNVYGYKFVENGGWQGIPGVSEGGGSWGWRIGIPQHLVDILLFMEPVLTKEDIDKYLEPAFTIWSGNIIIGENTYSVALASLLSENLIWLQKTTIELSNNRYPLNTEGYGFKEDYLFTTHGHNDNHPYTSGYGTEAPLGRIVRVSSLLSGTVFEISHPDKYNMFMWFKESFEPTTYKGGPMAILAGRFLWDMDEQGRGIRLFRALIDMLGMYGDQEDEYFKALVKRHVNDENTTRSGLLLAQVVPFMEIMNDDSIVVPDNYKINKMYYYGDKMIHQRDGWAAAVSMCSTRVHRYESHSKVNINGFYRSDGMLYLYTDGNLYQYGRHYMILANPYHMPGTTVDTQERDFSYNTAGEEPLPTNDFAGGVSFENEYGTAAMMLEAYNNELKRDSGRPELHKCSLAAQKAWFLFDDEVVALGSDINADDGFDVHTVVENRQLYLTKDGIPGSEDIIVDGTLMPKTAAYEKNFENPKWAYLEKVGGFYFPSGGNIQMKKVTSEEQAEFIKPWFYNRPGGTGIPDVDIKTNNGGFLEMWFDHGISPKNKKYSYVLLPHKTLEEVAAYTENPDISILSNTKQLAAVKENKLNITSMVFWEPGVFDNISSSEALIVMVRESNGEYVISLCDPIQKLKNAQLVIDKSLSLVESDDELNVELGEKTVINVNFGNTRGKTLTAKFRVK